MIISCGTKKPVIHAGAYVAPSAVVSGEVTIEEGCAVLFGAVITAEGAPVVIGANSVIMENAVLKSSGGSAMQFPLTIGESCIVGPGAYVVGATLEPGCVVAAGERIRNGQTIPEQSTVGDLAPSFFSEIFNVPGGDDVRSRAAETYAKFLRKTHAQDAIVAQGPKKAAPKPPLRKTEEPPPAQNVEVEKVVDVMFVELEEARLRREAAIAREKKGRK